MSSYAPDVRQFNKQRHADARRHEKHLQRQQDVACSRASSDGLRGNVRPLPGAVDRLPSVKGNAK